MITPNYLPVIWAQDWVLRKECEWRGPPNIERGAAALAPDSLGSDGGGLSAGCTGPWQEFERRVCRELYQLQLGVWVRGRVMMNRMSPLLPTDDYIIFCKASTDTSNFTVNTIINVSWYYTVYVPQVYFITPPNEHLFKIKYKLCPRTEWKSQISYPV